jgi:hypothetical protein
MNFKPKCVGASSGGDQCERSCVRPNSLELLPKRLNGLVRGLMSPCHSGRLVKFDVHASKRRQAARLSVAVREIAGSFESLQSAHQTLRS